MPPLRSNRPTSRLARLDLITPSRAEHCASSSPFAEPASFLHCLEPDSLSSRASMFNHTSPNNPNSDDYLLSTPISRASSLAGEGKDDRQSNMSPQALTVLKRDFVSPAEIMKPVLLSKAIDESPTEDFSIGEFASLDSLSISPFEFQNESVFFPITSFRAGSWFFDHSNIYLCYTWKTCRFTVYMISPSYGASNTTNPLYSPPLSYRLSFPLSSIVSFNLFNHVDEGNTTLILHRDTSTFPNVLFDTCIQPGIWRPGAKDFTHLSQALACSLWSVELADAGLTIGLLNKIVEMGEITRQPALMIEKIKNFVWTGTWNAGWSLDELHLVCDRETKCDDIGVVDSTTQENGNKKEEQIVAMLFYGDGIQRGERVPILLKKHFCNTSDQITWKAAGFNKSYEKNKPLTLSVPLFATPLQPVRHDTSRISLKPRTIFSKTDEDRSCTGLISSPLEPVSTNRLSMLSSPIKLNSGYRRRSLLSSCSMHDLEEPFSSPVSVNPLESSPSTIIGLWGSQAQEVDFDYEDLVEKDEEKRYFADDLFYELEQGREEPSVVW